MSKTNNNHFKIKLVENESIPFDLHYIRTEVRNKKTKTEKFHYINKYAGEDVILDFYKKNANIIDPDQ